MVVSVAALFIAFDLLVFAAKVAGGSPLPGSFAAGLFVFTAGVAGGSPLPAGCGWKGFAEEAENPQTGLSEIVQPLSFPN